MAIPVVTGASIMCSMGMGTGSLTATAQAIVTYEGKMVATTMDVTPMVNVSSCGMCTSMANPAVASATAAALGVLTPQPCVPAPAGSWMGSPGPTIGGRMALANDATLTCSYGGAIKIVTPGQAKVVY